MGTSQAPPAQTVVDARPSQVSPKTSKSENAAQLIITKIRCEFPRRFRPSHYFLPPQSVISFALTEEVPKRPDAGSVCRRDNTGALSSP
jgi:hypothetical protein